MKYEDIVKFHLCKLPSMEIQRIHSNFYSTLLGAKKIPKSALHSPNLVFMAGFEPKFIILIF